MRTVICLLGALALTTPAAAKPPAVQSGVQLVPAFGGRAFNRPICVTHNGTDTFVCEQTTGKILRVQQDKAGKTKVSTYVDLGSKLSTGGQGGLLGLAFHPKFATEGRFFVSYLAPGPAKDPNGFDRFQLRVSELRGTATAGDRSSEKLVVWANKKRNTHNGGGLAFSPDGMLYLSVGDGGGAQADELLAVQRAETMLGRFFAFDVSTPFKPKAAPTNKWADTQGAIGYLFAYGYRNPWRFDWDAQGRLWTVEPGTKGVGSREWVTEVKRGQHGRWPFYEGDQRREKVFARAKMRAGGVEPAFVYGSEDAGGHTAGVGGKFYRGTALPALKGKFVFCDYMRKQVYVLDLSSGKGTGWAVIAGCASPADIGSDAAGELYVSSIDTGVVYKLVAK